MDRFEYARERELNHIKNKITDDLEYKKELHKLYNSYLDEIQRELGYLYSKYASKEGLTIEEAMKRADTTDILNFAERAKEYVKNKDFSQLANDELRLYNLKMKTSRLELMKYEIMLSQMKLSGKETEMLYGRLKETLIEEAERQAGILGLGKEAIKEFINNPESIINGDYKGVNFSDRIWTNGYELRNDLQKGLQRSMLQGYNPREWSRNLERNLKERMGDTGKSNSFFNAFRLAVTESARVQTMTSLGLMTKGGYEKYMWIAEPDACPICSPYDGEVFDIKNSSLGDDLPPLHPFCRCSIAAYYDMDEDRWEDISSGYNDKIYPISEETIDKVSSPYIDSLSKEENLKITELHKRLLEFARDNNQSMEVAYKMNSLFEKPDIILGTKTDLNLGHNETKFVFHNHPNNEFFSNQDLVYFASTATKYMSIVKHNGLIAILEKTEDFDVKKFATEYKRAEKKYQNLIDRDEQMGYNKVVQRIIKKVMGIKVLEE